VNNRSISHLRAIGFALIGYTLWVGSDTFMKLAGEAAVPATEVAAFMGISGALLMVLYGWYKGKVKALWPKHPKKQIGRALLNMLSLIFNVIALKHLTLTLFFVTVFTNPMMVALLAAVFLKEKLTLGKILAIVGGFIGVLIAINPFQDFGQGEWIGYAAATASTVCFALGTTWLKHMAQSETTDSITFFTALFGGICCSVFLPAYAHPLSAHLVLILFGTSFFAIVGNFAFYASLKHTTATNVAQFHYTQIVMGALCSFIIWHDVPSWNVYLGAAVIIGSGLYIANHARKAENIAAATPL
jgi:drug/metabolite transporter (DMT)-like permease